jgi:HrpA-like RNA helicase
MNTNLPQVSNHQIVTPQAQAATDSIETRIPPIGNRSLPIWDKMGEVIDYLNNGNRLILSSPTGSGKTTQIPQALYHAGFTEQGKIYVVENRVVVAIETARRVAHEMGVRVGEEVGFLTGPDKNSSDKTKIVFLTSGVFRQILRRDPMLQNASVVLLDEFDERDLLTDLSASLIAKAQSSGSNVKFVLMSATLNAQKFSRHFDDAPIVEAKGRMFRVTTEFQSTPIDNWEKPKRAAEIAADIHGNEDSGDILIFMPGKPEINEVIRHLEHLKVTNAQILPLHGELSPHEREKIFEPCSERKIIVSTNIAERGITIDGVVYVIDPASVRMQQYDANSDANLLRIVDCAQDSLQQRRGRAGRTQPGVYYPLLTQDEYDQREKSTAPEIQRTALRDVVLQIKDMGYSRDKNPLQIIDYPDKQNWKIAKEQLRLLGALDSTDETKLSPFGEKLSELGCGSRDAAMILHGSDLGCGTEAVTIAAIRMSRKMFYTPRDEKFEAQQAHAKFFTSRECDLLNLFRAYEAAREANFEGSWCRENYISWQSLREIRQNEEQLTKRALAAGCTLNHRPSTNSEAICQAISNAFPDRVYISSSRGSYYAPFGNDQRLLGRESTVVGDNAKLIIATELLTIQRRDGRSIPLITSATATKLEWLPQGEEIKNLLR